MHDAGRRRLVDRRGRPTSLCGSAISEVSLKGCGAALVPFPAFDGGALLVAGVKRAGRVLRVLMGAGVKSMVALRIYYCRATTRRRVARRPARESATSHVAAHRGGLDSEGHVRRTKFHFEVLGTACRLSFQRGEIIDRRLHPMASTSMEHSERRGRSSKRPSSAT